MLGAALISVMLPAQSACLLVEVFDPNGAEHRVYFTNFRREDDSNGRFQSCRLLDEPAPGAQPFFVTKFRQDASVVVHRDNWPR